MRPDRPNTAETRVPGSGARFEVVDIIRGLAVFGILVVNMQFFNSSLKAISLNAELWPDKRDQIAQLLIEIFAEGKFISIFSFLFGYSMILFRERVEGRGLRFAPLFARRLLALAGFGLIHGLLIWYGDILFHYALLGFVLMLFARRRPRTLLVWSVALLALLPALASVAGGQLPDPEATEAGQRAMIHDTAVYGRGSWLEIQRQRIADWTAEWTYSVTFYPQLLGLFLLGAYFGKRKILHDPSAHRTWLRVLGIRCLILGFGLTSVMVLAERNILPAPAGMGGILVALGYLVGAPLLGLAYICMTALLYLREPWKRRLKPLGAVGRMAFSNYIFQSVVCTAIFYSYGFGLYGKVPPLAGLGLAVALFAAQLVASRWWLRTFAMGPLEWVWRLATYGRVPPW
ncbi:MAG: DUF418 domain-containing protein, partial [Alicyclobacillaceae bacterium]|nr:DUF418 domain-containing protein [Alicyclobacillaceae bacterium]